MSSTFRPYGAGDEVPRDWPSALFASSLIHVAVAALLVAVGTGARRVVTEKPVDVTFVEKVARPEPPPPPVEIKAEPAPPPAAAPVVPRDMKVRKLEKPPPPKELVAPKEMPREAPKEADPSEDRGIAVVGEPGEGDPAGREAGTAGGSAGGQAGAIELPDGAAPPVPATSNAVPSYPKTARRAGKEGSVTLRIVIASDGLVTDVQVVEGEEPFVGAAVEAVKKWRYEPARYRGQPISVYRIIQVGFRLNA